MNNFLYFYIFICNKYLILYCIESSNEDSYPLDQSYIEGPKEYLRQHHTRGRNIDAFVHRQWQRQIEMALRIILLEFYYNEEEDGDEGRRLWRWEREDMENVWWDLPLLILGDRDNRCRRTMMHGEWQKKSLTTGLMVVLSNFLAHVVTFMWIG